MTKNTFKVLGLKAQNILNLEFIELNTDGKSVTLIGPNGSGKTNVFDTILLGMGWIGKKEIPDPIRHGQKSGDIELDLGDIVVRRHISQNGTVLRVENKDGMVFKSPQTLLNGFRHKISFDPQEFTGLPEKQQKEILLSIIDLPIDLEEQDKHREEIFKNRTLVNRDVRRREGQLAGIPDIPNIPDDETSTAGVLADMQVATEQIAVNNNIRSKLTAETDRRVKVKMEQEQINADILKLQDKAEHIKIDLATSDQTIATMKDIVAELIDPDIEQFKCQIEDVETTNIKVRKKQERNRILSSLINTREMSQSMTDDIQNIDDLKSKTIQEANMPIPGLSLGDMGITFEGFPLKQRSSGEQIEVAMAISMAMNPKLRVIWIQNASLLDDERMNIVKTMAKKAGYQLWLERVEHEGEVGIHIKEGRIVS